MTAMARPAGRDDLPPIVRGVVGGIDGMPSGRPSMAEVVERVARGFVDEPEAGATEVAEWVREADPLLDLDSVATIVDRIVDRHRGLGVLDPLLADRSVTEIMINGPGPVWVDRGRRLEPTTVALDEHDLTLVTERILDPLGLRVDRSSPFVDARLADGSRVNIIVPPLALDGMIVTIRRFAPVAVDIGEFGDDAVVDLLASAVAERRTMLVSGATAAGKTTLLNALGAFVEADERIVTIEDTAELRLPGRHVVRLESRPANSEGVGEVTLRQLVRNALRMRPDRLVIGEVRGPEALDLVLALNTGHRGSLATCHASDPTGAVRRLSTLASLADAAVPLAAIQEQIAGAIDVVVHVARLGGERRVVEVATLGADGHLTTEWRHGRWPAGGPS